MSRDASPGVMFTPQLILFLHSLVLTNDRVKAVADAQLPETFDVDSFLEQENVAQKLAELREAAIAVAMENEDTIIARSINWAHADIADYFHFPESSVGPEYTNLSGVKLKNVANMPATMRHRIKKIKISPIVQAGQVITHTAEIELHDPMRANAEVARLKKIGEEMNYSAQERAQQLYEFLTELETIHNVRDAEFPLDDSEHD